MELGLEFVKKTRPRPLEQKLGSSPVRLRHKLKHNAVTSASSDHSRSIEIPSRVANQSAGGVRPIGIDEVKSYTLGPCSRTRGRQLVSSAASVRALNSPSVIRRAIEIAGRVERQRRLGLVSSRAQMEVVENVLSPRTTGTRAQFEDNPRLPGTARRSCAVEITYSIHNQSATREYPVSRPAEAMNQTESPSACTRNKLEDGPPAVGPAGEAGAVNRSSRTENQSRRTLRVGKKSRKVCRVIKVHDPLEVGVNWKRTQQPVPSTPAQLP